MLINVIKDLIVFILQFYFAFGIVCTLIFFITDIILMRRIPKIKNVLFNYLIWPLTGFYWIKYLLLFIKASKKYSNKTKTSFSQSFKEILKDYKIVNSSSLFN